MKFYFTFGQVHRHPKTEELMCDYWIEVNAVNWDYARDIMVSHYGITWGFQYTEKNFNPIWFPAGCYEILDTLAVKPEPQSANIETPEGGEPIYLLHLTYKNDIVGFVKCKDHKDLEEFKAHYNGLEAKGWCSLVLSFDAGEPE